MSARAQAVYNDRTQTELLLRSTVLNLDVLIMLFIPTLKLNQFMSDMLLMSSCQGVLAFY